MKKRMIALGLVDPPFYIMFLFAFSSAASLGGFLLLCKVAIVLIAVQSLKQCVDNSR
jgi:hypothetical protein